MTVQETIVILAMLSAYYGEGKSDPEQMVPAWHVILKDYDFATAQIAVVNFAKTDYRDYATFPSVGKIVQAIDAERLKRRAVFNAALSEKPYEELDNQYREIVTEEQYRWMVAQGYDKLNEQKERILEGMMPKALPELESAYGRV